MKNEETKKEKENKVSSILLWVGTLSIIMGGALVAGNSSPKAYLPPDNMSNYLISLAWYMQDMAEYIRGQVVGCILVIIGFFSILMSYITLTIIKRFENIEEKMTQNNQDTIEES